MREGPRGGWKDGRTEYISSVNMLICSETKDDLRKAIAIVLFAANDSAVPVIVAEVRGLAFIVCNIRTSLLLILLLLVHPTFVVVVIRLVSIRVLGDGAFPPLDFVFERREDSFGINFVRSSSHSSKFPICDVLGVP